MPVLKAGITQLHGDLDSPFAWREAARAADEVLTAAFGVVGRHARQPRPVKRLLIEGATQDISRARIGFRFLLPDRLIDSVHHALERICSTTSAFALESLDGHDPDRRHFVRINQALGAHPYIADFQFQGRTVLLRDLGLAANAALDQPFSGEICMVDLIWQDAAVMIEGRDPTLGRVQLLMRDDPQAYVRLAREHPSCLRFHGRGRRSTRLTRVLPVGVPRGCDQQDVLSFLNGQAGG